MPGFGNQEDTNGNTEQPPRGGRARWVGFLRLLGVAAGISGVTRKTMLVLGSKAAYGVGGGLLGLVGIMELALRYRAQRSGAGSEEPAIGALEEGQIREEDQGQEQGQLATLGSGATVSRTDEIPSDDPSLSTTTEEERVTRLQLALV